MLLSGHGWIKKAVKQSGVSLSALVGRESSKAGKCLGQAKQCPPLRTHRALALEQLESRELLSADTDVLNNQAMWQQNVGTEETAVYVTTLSDRVDSSDGLISLREALGYVSHYTQDRGVIKFCVQGTITLLPQENPLTITRSLLIDATNSGTITLDANGQSRIFTIQKPENSSTPVSVEMANLALVNGHASQGGGIFVGQNARLTLTEVALTNCTASDSGGGLLASGSVELRSVSISACNAEKGGGIHVASSGSLTASNSRLEQNTASGSGGGLASDGSFSLFDCAITANQATNGGGIALNPGNASVNSSVTNSSFINNIATNAGGALHAGGELTASNCEFSNNSGKDGGALAVILSKVLLSTSRFQANHASQYGGALYVSGSLQAVGVDLADNTATSGGALYNQRQTQLVQCSLIGNVAKTYAGGGIYNKGTLFLEASRIENNSSANEGGGLSNATNDGTCYIDACSFLNNSTESYGAGIGNSGKSIKLTNSIISGNYTTDESLGLGGGVYNDKNAQFNSDGATYYNNYALKGGAFYNLGIAGFQNSRLTANLDTAGTGFAQIDPGLATFDNESGSVYGNLQAVSASQISPLFSFYDENGQILTAGCDSLAPVINLGTLATGEINVARTLTFVYTGPNSISLTSLSRSSVFASAFSDDASSSYTLQTGQAVTITLTPTALSQTGVQACSLTWNLSGGDVFKIVASYLVADTAAQLTQSHLISVNDTSYQYIITIPGGASKKATIYLVADAGLHLTNSQVNFETGQSVVNIVVTLDKEYLADHANTEELRVRHFIASDFDASLTAASASLVPDLVITVNPYSVIETWQQPPLGDYLVRDLDPCICVDAMAHNSVPEILSLRITAYPFSDFPVQQWRIDWGDGIIQTYNYATLWLNATHYYSTSGAKNMLLSWFDSAKNAWSDLYFIGSVYIAEKTASASLPPKSTSITQAVANVLEEEELLIPFDESVELLSQDIVARSAPATQFPLDLLDLVSGTKKKSIFLGT
ncbi:MAG: hypothetical protein Q4G68_12275 [Planctomycetia bacterium]|nr:hypothetical protein [Planctomycetia bacterium]